METGSATSSTRASNANRAATATAYRQVPGASTAGSGCEQGQTWIDNRVSFRNRESPIDRDMEIGMHPVSEPACPHLVHALHPVDMKRRVLDLGQDARFDTVEQAKAWWDSPEYARAREARQDFMVLKGLIIEGV